MLECIYFSTYISMVYTHLSTSRAFIRVNLISDLSALSSLHAVRPRSIEYIDT